MSLFQRVATFATIAFGVVSLAGASTPGFAKQLNRDVNASSYVMVPFLGEISSNPSQAQQPGLQDVAKAPVAPAAIAPAALDTASDDSGDEFDSLSEAVAAQNRPDQLDRDLTCLAGAIYFEAKGEPLVGQLAVAEVILNRAKSGRFAKSVCAVVTQAGQFSFVRGGRIPAIGDNANYRTAIAVAQVAMGDHWDSPAPNALFFHARRVSPGWRMQKVASIGNHVFYR